MRILLLGDSITEGVGASEIEKSFAFLLGKKLNAEIINYGVGGTRIARQKNLLAETTSLYNYDFNLRSEIMVNEADLVICFGGTNDFGHGSAALGNKNDTTPYTFYGAVNTLFNNLISKYSRDKVIILMPLPRFNQDLNLGKSLSYKNGVEGTLKDYKNIIYDVATRLNLKILDYENIFNKPLSDGPTDLFIDGLHPNDKGHELLADLLSKDILKFIR